MSSTYVYPENIELRAIAQEKSAVLMMDDPIFDILPVQDVDAAEVEWEQMDNFRGLQQIRGLGGDPPRVARVGHRKFRQPPGVYGEFTTIDETEITRRRPVGQFTGAIDVNSLVLECQDQLLNRRIDRLRLIGWKLVVTGTFLVAGPNGATLHSGTFTLQTSSGSDWSTPATATPLADYRAAQPLSRGKGVNFGKAANSYMNRTTFNRMISNTNAADLYGKRTQGLANVLSLNDANVLLAGEDLPMIHIYDEGYEDDDGNFQLFIPDDKVVIVGARPAGQRVGEYQMVRNANNDNEAPGAYQKVVDTAKVSGRPPRNIEVHDGHNGGPVLFFPSAIVVMSV